jgi:selenocysteine-specific elongation factor
VVEALVAAGRLVADGPVVRLPGHAERLDPAQLALRERVEQAVDEAGVGLLGDAALAELGADRKATALLVRTGVLVAVGPGGYLGRSTLERAVETLRRSFPDGRPFAATEAKEALGTTRRTAIPLLEHLDRTGVTVRHGDLRRLTQHTGGSSPPRSAGVVVPRSQPSRNNRQVGSDMAEWWPDAPP